MIFCIVDFLGFDIILYVVIDIGGVIFDDEDFIFIESFKNMVVGGILGDKLGSGFYKKIKDEKGKIKIFNLNL